MKSPWWSALAVAWVGLALPGVRAPATFFIKHMSTDDKEGFPSLTSPQTPISSFSFTTGTTPFPVKKSTQNDFQSRIYPGTTYNEDFGTYAGDNSLTTGFGFTSFNLPPGEVSPTAADKSREDYGPTGYNVESGEPPDYQTFYSSGEEEQRPPSAPIQPSEEDHRDYNEEDDSTPINYEVEEKIPDDLKYKPPKVTVYPLPPPCKGATPPPWPTNPPPPKPPPKKPKPKPKPGGGSGYYTLSAYPGHRPATRAQVKFRPSSSTRYRAAKPKSRLVYQQTPYIIRYSGAGNRPILIRHRTVRPVTVGHPKRIHKASKKPAAKTKEIIREVHIHHHHSPPLHPIPHPIPIVPIIPLLDENGHPLPQPDPLGRKPFSMQITSSGSGNMDYFSPFGLTPSGSDNVGVIAAAPSPPIGSDNLAVGRFAEPPPHTTSSYKATDSVNSSAIASQSAVEITG